MSCSCISNAVYLDPLSLIVPALVADNRSGTTLYWQMKVVTTLMQLLMLTRVWAR